VVLLRSDRGQVFAADLMVAVTLFLAAMAAVAWGWGYSKARMDSAMLSQSMESEAYMLSDMLVKSCGSPPDWHKRPLDANVSSVGLADRDRVLSEGKFEAVEAADYQLLRDMFGLGPMQWHIMLRSPEGRELGRAGRPPAGDMADMAYSSSRIVAYRNQTAVLELTIWEDSPPGGQV
jgi:hypothetical protein